MPQQQDLEVIVPSGAAHCSPDEINKERHDLGEHGPEHGLPLPVSYRRRTKASAEAERS